MKKFYTTLALAAAVVFGASAEGIAKKAPVKMQELSQLEGSLHYVDPSTVSKPAKSPAKAISSTTDMQGFWTIQQTSYLQKDGGATVSKSLVFYVQDETTVLMDGFGVNAVDEMVPFTVDFTTQKATFSTYYMGYDDYNEIDVSFLLAKFTSDNTVEWIDSTEADIVDGEIVFDPNVIVGTGLAGTGYFFLGYDNIMTSDVDEAPSMDGFVSCGTAAFQDGWILTGLFDEDEIPVYNVELYKSTTEDNVYRLYNPYADYNSTIAQLLGDQYVEYYGNISTVPGVIEFNITDPKCVLVKPDLYSGVKSYFVSGKFYNYNEEGYNYYVEGYGYSDLDGVWDNPSTYDEKTNTADIYNIVFALTEGGSSYSWQYSDGTTVDCHATIVLYEGENSINEIVVDQNAPVEYYNLQGLRVDENTHGLVIRKQGSTATKIVR